MTFLPIKSIRGRERPNKKIAEEPGFVGFAPDCITYDKKFENIISYLLGRVVVVRDLEHALRISKLDFDLLTVTMDGEIINARGAITGGRFKHKSANILDRRTEMANLEKSIKEGAEKQEFYSSKLEGLKDEIKSLADDIAELDEKQRGLESSLMLKESAISVAKSVLDDMVSSADRVDRELESIQQEQENSNGIIEKVKADLKAKQEASAEAEKTCEEKLSLYETKKTEANEINEEIIAARILVTTCNEKKTHADDIADRIKASIAEIKADIETRKRQMAILEEEKGQITEGHVDIDEMIRGLEDAKTSAEERLQTVTDEKAALTASLASLNNEREELTGKIQGFQDQKYDLDVRKCLLREGETMNVIAAPKTGKSWLVMNLALAVALGQDWMGFPCEQGKVLIIDNELHPATTAYRFRSMLAKLGVPRSAVSPFIHVENQRGMLETIQSLSTQIEELKKEDYKLIIIDAFYRAVPQGTNENDNGSITALYNLLDRYAGTLNSAFALIHHTSKGNQSQKSVTDVGAGAGAQSRAADTHLVLRPHKEKGVIAVDCAVRSFAPIQPFCLRFDWPVWFRDDSFNPEDLEGKAEARPRKSAAETLTEAERLAKLMPEFLTPGEAMPKDPLTKAIIKKHLCTRQTARDAVDEAIASGIIRYVKPDKTLPSQNRAKFVILCDGAEDGDAPGNDGENSP